MSKIEDILKSKIKPKEKREKIVEAVCKGKIPAKEFIKFFKKAPDKEKGSCADAMKHISKSNPEILKPYADILIEHINYKAPRVKWGIQQAIGNLAKEYPEKISKAVPHLLENTKEDKTNKTVIRWSAAYAITEIAKNSKNKRKELLPFIKKIIKKEKNNGVKNVYIKALKEIEKK
ncbi:MAG: hypothetical protein GF370_03705 [Candidatus Nealsonbacteria bacterium]|nr:hypothetical protein [Candidatus Nealsonbacteria bacterium]